MAPVSMLELLVCSVPLLSLFSSFPLWYTLLSAFSAKLALCLFAPGMSCLFWDIESPHPMRFTGCLLTVLATYPPTFLLWLSFSGRGFTCKPVIAVGSMVKPFCHRQTPITIYCTLKLLLVCSSTHVLIGGLSVTMLLIQLLGLVNLSTSMLSRGMQVMLIYA